MKKTKQIIGKFIAYIWEEFKYKLLAIGLIALGLFTLTLDKDATFSVFMLLIGLPLLFVSKDYMEELENEEA